MMVSFSSSIPRWSPSSGPSCWSRSAPRAIRGKLAQEVGPAGGDVVVGVVDARAFGEGFGVVGPDLRGAVRDHELNTRGFVEEDRVDRGFLDRGAGGDDAVADEKEAGAVADGAGDRAAELGRHDQVAGLAEARD